MMAFLSVFIVLVLNSVFLADFAFGQCREGWHYQEGSCYGFGETTVTWGNAEQLCKVFSAKLAEIETEDENTFLKYLAQAKKAKAVWVGGTDILDEGNWQWIKSGNAIEYTDWADGQPDEWTTTGEDCLQLFANAGYKWNDFACDDTANFLCEAEPQTPIVG